MAVIQTRSLTLSYDTETVIQGLDFTLLENKITVFVGSNGCGKSTLLRSLARLLEPKKGAVLLNGKDMNSLKSSQVAKSLAISPQGPIAPEGLTVFNLVKQGRYPYQHWYQQWTEEDEKMVNSALENTQLTDLMDCPLDSLSGGQRQRAWIALALAQGTDTILLDEPTTYLDLRHQVEVLDLLFDLNKKEGRTIVLVLHDLNLAFRYANQIVALANKQIYVQGKPEEVVTRKMVHDVFQLKCEVSTDPIFGTPFVIPFGKGRNLYESNMSV
ncbi:ABC transporter ATP-binding protein [Aquibacillus rhizosphaerae]|uniref:ABC transporter ATP-binding protein n=1 Tax=Aquibacillus rhizosphaerae TaxID=3051431 RepID=A0ABT7L8G0_9BACI|nr:ABC transporter ATP-binding protein [Aquibacillus sp. LR5S19]MDL4842146.1 ABC transporter ATP-binding protein [Aquibacillus sp. LR5S19]